MRAARELARLELPASAAYEAILVVFKTNDKTKVSLPIRRIS
jgi:hypothetical protein